MCRCRFGIGRSARAQRIRSIRQPARTRDAAAPGRARQRPVPWNAVAEGPTTAEEAGLLPLLLGPLGIAVLPVQHYGPAPGSAAAGRGGEAPPGITFAGATGSNATALDGSYVFDLGINDSSGSETDTSYGSNAWSVQDNTNFFKGNNGHTDWVQFAFQYFGSGTPNTCIWQVDVTVARATHNASGYDATGCYAMSAGPETVWGWDLHNAGIPLLGVETVTSPARCRHRCGPTCSGWKMARTGTAASGGILGAAAGSKAVFSPGWQEDEVASVSDCDTYFDPICNQGKLPSGTTEFASSVTAESSNLSTPSTPKLTWVSGHHTAYVQYLANVP